MKRTGLFFIIALVVLGISGCNPGEKTETQETADSQEPQETVFAVNTTNAVKGQIFDYIEVNGDIKASSSVDVYPDTAGKVSSIFIKIGQRVSKDQELLNIDPSRPGMNFAKSPVKAPIAGTITALPAQIGSSSSPAIPVATISRMDSLEIVTSVSERYVSKVMLGQRGIIELEAYPDLRFEGLVTELSPVLDPASRTMEIKLAIREKDAKIKAGMFAKIKLIVEDKENIVKIPSSALVSRFGTYQVFVVNGEHVEQRRVTPGILIDNKLEIVDGLTEGEKVVVRGQSLLEDKAKVKIIDEIQPLSSKDEIE